MSDEHTADASDEGRHIPDPDELWNESWYADVVTPDGSLAAYIRLGLYPNLGTAWWHVAIVGPDRPVVVCQRADVPVPAEGLAVSTDGIDVALTIDAALASFSVRGSMTGERYDNAGDVYGAASGEAARIDLDLTWETDGTPYQYAVTTRYEIPCAVTGSVTVDGERLRLDGPGQRDHSWGVRDWWTFGWCWSSGHLEDGTHTHLTEVRVDGGPFYAGYVQDRSRLTPVSGGQVSEEVGEHGFPAWARVRHDDLVVEVDPIAFGPILLTSPDGRVGRSPEPPRASPPRMAGMGSAGSNGISHRTGRRKGRLRNGTIGSLPVSAYGAEISVGVAGFRTSASGGWARERDGHAAAAGRCALGGPHRAPRVRHARRGRDPVHG